MPKKLNTLLLMVCWKPLENASVMIITATLMAVATVDNRMINREKVRCGLNAILPAINGAIFNGMIFFLQK